MRRKPLSVVAILSAFAGSTVLAATVNTSPAPAATLLAPYNACFMLYDLSRQKMVSEYNPGNRCDERLAANSTFKVALSLMAFDQGLINPQSVFRWDGVKRDLADWNQDQTPKTWLQYSAVWVSQALTPQLGLDTIQRYLAGFHYGNQDFSGDPGKRNGLTHAWLSSSLRISANEQLAFLKAMQSGQLPVSADAVANTRQNMYLGQLANGAAYYGKTGAGRHKMHADDAQPGPLRDGWFIGYVDHDAHQYAFVSNLTDRQAPASGVNMAGSQVLKPLTLRLLNDYFAHPLPRP